MLIANPIYDSAFKYLLEDADLARGFLATFLGEEIVSIEVKPQETTTEAADYGISIFRLDFKAVVKTIAGERRKVLIELQKAKRLLDIMRFRRYLANNYQEEDSFAGPDGVLRNTPLPIVTVYLLGFKMAQQVTDVLTGQVIVPRPREPFVELLHHESYTVQIPMLTEEAKTRLESMLMIFNQEHRTDDPQVLDFTGDLSDPLVKKMVKRLARAISDPQLRREMDAEDEVNRTITRLLHEQELEHQAEFQAALQEKEAALQEKEAALQEKEATLREKELSLQEKDILIAELKKQLAEQQK